MLDKTLRAARKRRQAKQLKNKQKTPTGVSYVKNDRPPFGAGVLAGKIFLQHQPRNVSSRRSCPRTYGKIDYRMMAVTVEAKLAGNDSKK
jgi:hypothetical protein